MNTLPDSSRHNADQQIDRPLAALNRAEAPADLQQRVLRGIELRQSKAPANRRWIEFLLPRMPWYPLTLAATGLVAFALGLAFAHRRPAHRAATAATPQPFLTLSPKTPTPLRSVAQDATAKRTFQAAVTRDAWPHQHVTAATPQVAPAEQDHPAPELPLTAQERLLVRIAYGPQPQQRPPQQQLAMLHRTGMRLRPPADDETDFNSFFEPYTTPLTEGDPQ